MTSSKPEADKMAGSPAKRKFRPHRYLVAGFALGVVFCTGIIIGYGVNRMDGSAAETEQATSNLPPELEELMLRADAAHGGKAMAMATGLIDDDVEGLFVLDYLTGDLFCWVPAPAGGWMAQYKTNVIAEFGIDKDKAPDYVLTTGYIRPARGGGVTRPAYTLCYVADANTGRVAAFTLEWNRTAAQAGRQQAGPLLKLAEGLTRGNIERD